MLLLLLLLTMATMQKYTQHNNSNRNRSQQARGSWCNASKCRLAMDGGWRFKGGATACCHIRCRCSGKTWAHDSSNNSSSSIRSSRKMPTSALHAEIAAADLQFNVDAIEMKSWQVDAFRDVVSITNVCRPVCGLVFFCCCCCCCSNCATVLISLGQLLSVYHKWSVL